MRIITADHVRKVDAINVHLWQSVYSMVTMRLSEDDKDFLQFAMDFLNTGECAADDAQITARQLELVRRRLAKLNPAEDVCEKSKAELKASFGNAVNADAVSCADLYLTADGKDLFVQLIDLLKYADQYTLDVLREEDA